MFENKTVIVTGAALGIGYATAMQFAKSGANVVMVDYNKELLQKAEKNISQINSNVLAYSCDVSDEERVCEISKEILEKFGKIDILVNNAGIWRCDIEEFANSISEHWKKKIDINILGTMYFTRAVIDNMIENNYGRIINLGSVAGVYGNRNMVDYSMTKGAIIAFTKALAKEVAPKGITVNTVSPGNIKVSAEDEDNLNLSFTPRSGTTQEVADLICFLASDKASYISGQNYLIDGSRKAM